MDVHERWYYELYDNDFFYNDIRNGLWTLVSRHINNFQDAVHELYNVCARTHHTITTPLCEPCTVTKDLIREVANGEHPELVLFYRTSSYFYDD